MVMTYAAIALPAVSRIRILFGCVRDCGLLFMRFLSEGLHKGVAFHRPPCACGAGPLPHVFDLVVDDPLKRCAPSKGIETQSHSEATCGVFDILAVLPLHETWCSICPVPPQESDTFWRCDLEVLVIVTEGIDRAHRKVDHHVDWRGWEPMTERREFLDVIHVLRNRLDFIERCICVCTETKG